MQGRTGFGPATWIWKNGAPLKCKKIVWLAIKHRIWTSDRRARHNLQDQPSPCFVCLQEIDEAEHILVQCVYARQVWMGVFQQLGVQANNPESHSTLEEWWGVERARFRGRGRKQLDALWKNRNTWVFGNQRQQSSTNTLIQRVTEEYHTWCMVRRGVSGVFIDVARE